MNEVTISRYYLGLKMYNIEITISYNYIVIGMRFYTKMSMCSTRLECTARNITLAIQLFCDGNILSTRSFARSYTRWNMMIYSPLV